MTSCLLLKAPDRLVAVADGRLATSERAVSFDTAEKIRSFTPKYKIPRVAMGWFSHYSEAAERDWYLAYAGTYALVSQIGDVFMKNISGGLVLNRGERGIPRLDYDFDEGGSFDDSYNFKNDELLPITPRVIVDELLAAAQTKCNEWTANGRDPDCEFLLFGEAAETHRYAAFKVAPDLSRWHRGEPAPFQKTPVADGIITSIGSPTVAKAVAADQDLQSGARAWQTNQSDVGIHNLFADPEFAAFLGGEPREPLPEPPPEENWAVEKVRGRFVEHMLSASDHYVGGNFMAVSGFGYQLIKSTIKIS